MLKFYFSKSEKAKEFLPFFACMFKDQEYNYCCDVGQEPPSYVLDWEYLGSGSMADVRAIIKPKLASWDDFNH